MIPLLDPAPELELLWPDLQMAALSVLRSGQYILGPQVTTFEEEVAAYLGVNHAIGLNSGTDALFLALRALEIGPGDEVITTPFTFFATAEAISHVGATPVFVDIEPTTYNLDPALVVAAITPKTRAIIPVHLFGHAAELTPLLELAEAHGLYLIEDVAQALGGSYRGQKLGTFGTVGAFSFFPTKNLGGYGDGGLVVTDDPLLAERLRKLRAHGSIKKYYNETVGYNSRLDELQAALLRVKLPHLDRFNKGRREVAQRYEDLLSGLPGVTLPTEADYATHVFHQFTVRLPSGVRDRLKRYLAEEGIQTMVYYPVALHRLPVYDLPQGLTPQAEAAAQEVLSLPIWPLMEPEVQRQVAAHFARGLALCV